MRCMSAVKQGIHECDAFIINLVLLFHNECNIDDNKSSNKNHGSFVSLEGISSKTSMIRTSR